MTGHNSSFLFLHLDAKRCVYTRTCTYYGGLAQGFVVSFLVTDDHCILYHSIQIRIYTLALPLRLICANLGSVKEPFPVELRLKQRLLRCSRRVVARSCRNPCDRDFGVCARLRCVGRHLASTFTFYFLVSMP